MSTRAQLLEQIDSTFTSMQRLMHANFHRAFEELKIAPSQLQLLMFIENMQPVSLKDLAAKMYLTPGAITQLVEGLVQQGYIERKPSEQDRRVICVAMTSEGTKKTAALQERKHEMFAKVVSELDDNELALFLRIQQKMLAQLETKICKETKEN